MSKFLIGISLILFIINGSAFAAEFGCEFFNSSWTNNVISIEPADAYDDLYEDVNTYILDVRTAAEWQWVGRPAGNGGVGGFLNNQTVNISFKIDKAGVFIDNESFANDVNDYFGDSDVTLIIMCRSGARGRAIKAACLLVNEEGYSKDKVFYMYKGFEGGMEDGYPTDGGWKNSCINGDDPDVCYPLPYNWSSTSTAYMEGAYPD